MHRLLSSLSSICLVAAMCVDDPVAQEPVAKESVAQNAAIRATLTAARPIIAAGSPIELRLLLHVEADTRLPNVLVNGVDLSVNVGDKPGPHIAEPGEGEPVLVRAGTRIERRLSFPSDRLVPNPDPSGVTDVVIAWTGLPGANCALKIAPDSSKVDIASLDLAKTKVVLVTNYGEMTLSLRPDKAPKHVENFLKLCKSGFYNGTKFHRVLRDFMIQGGDPNTKNDDKAETWGSGGPGWSVDAEFNDVRHLRGTLSMAREANPNSAGSQFFIVHKDSPHLDSKYTAFGNVEKGMDALDRIANVEVTGPEQSVPVKPVVLLSAIILPVKK